MKKFLKRCCLSVKPVSRLLKRRAAAVSILAATVFNAFVPCSRAAYTAELQLGQSGPTNSPNAVAASGFNQPRAIAIGGGRVYAADYSNNRVLWWTLGGFANGQAAEGVIGQADFSGAYPNRGGAAAKNTLFSPNGVAVDTAGNVWVADSGNNRVLRFPAPLANGADADLVLGQADFVLTGGNRDALIPGSDTLYYPESVAVDAAGNVWVADSANNRVMKFAIPAANGVAASLVLGQPDFTYDTSAASQAGMSYPISVAVDGSGNVWVSDYFNNRVLKYAAPAASGANASLVLGQADYAGSSINRGGAAAQNTMNMPAAVALNGTDVWVADSGNSRLLKFANPSLNGTDAALELGQADFISDLPNQGAITASASSLNTPLSVAVESNGKIWAADTSNYRILRYASASVSADAANLVLGQTNFTQSAINTPSSQTLYGPAAMAMDAATGRIYVADYSNNRVLWWDSAPAFSNGLAANGVLGQADFASTLPNRGGAAAANTLNAPAGVAVDSAGNLWVSDLGNFRILRFTAPAVNGESANRVLGQPNFTSVTPGAAGAATVYDPSAVAVDGAGKLWVADAGNNRVLRFSDFSANGTNADFVIGQGDFISSQANRGATVNINTLNYPSGVWVDGVGNVWVADTANNRVLKFSSLTAIGPDAGLVLGQADFISDLPSVSQGRLNSPTGVTVDLFGGNVWVSDMFNSRVVKFDAPSANGQQASLVLGQADFNGYLPNRGAQVPGMDTLAYPNAVYVDNLAKVWVADMGNNRTLRFDPFPKTALSPSFTAISSAAVSVSWISIPGASYVAVLSAASDFSSVISSATTAAASASFASLSPGSNYYFEVKLSTDTDAAFAINKASATTSPAATRLAASIVSVSSATINSAWTAVAGASYVVALSTNSDFSAVISSAAQTGATAAFSVLDPSTDYYLRVKLSTETDVAFAVNNITVRTSAPASMLTPVTTSVSSATVSIAWTNLAGSSYVALFASDSGFTNIISSATQSGSVSQFSGLTASTSYYFKVKLSTETDPAFEANVLTFITNPVATFLRPILTAVPPSTINVSWTAVPGASYVAVLGSDSNFSTVFSTQTTAAHTASYVGLSPNSLYYFEVKLSTETDFSYAGNTSALQPLYSATALNPSLTVNSSSMISASWPNITGTSYVVVLALDQAYTNIVSSATTAASASNASFAGLTGLTSYYFEIKISTESDAAFALNSGVRYTPATQLNPVFGSATTSGFTATWNAVAGASYVAVLAADSGFASIISSGTQTGASKTFTGLAVDTPYYFKVKIASEGDSAFGANTSQTRTAPTAVSPALSAVSPTSLSASWTAVAGANYVAVLASDPAYGVVVSSVTQSANTASFTGLSEYTTYYFEVKLAAESDAAFAANTAALRTLSYSTVLSPLVTAVSSATLNAAWTPVAGASYVVVLASDSGFATIVSSTVETGNSKVFNSLAAATTYYFQLKKSDEGDIAFTVNSAVQATLPAATLLAPSLASGSASTVSASWASVPGSGYVAVLALDSGFTSIVSSATTVSTVKNYTGLSEYTTYYFEIKLSGETDAAFAFNRTLVRTPAVHTPLAPAFISVSSMTASAAWNSAGAGAGYVVALSTNSDFNTIASSFTQTAVSLNFGGLIPATSYYLEVKLDSETDAAFIINRTTGFTPPATTDLLAVLTAVSSTTISAAWTPFLGANYVVVLAADSGYSSIVSSATQGANTAVFSGLYGGSNYYFKVKLANEADAAFALNTTAKATLPALTPIAPVLTVVSSAAVSAAWDSILGATYIAVLASDSGFVSIVSSASLNSNTISFPALSPDTTYYFEVKLSSETDVAYAANAAANKTAPYATDLSPVFNSVSSSLMTVDWQPVAGSAYVAVLASDSGYNSIISSTTQTANTINYAALNPDTPYYFKVKLSTETDTAFAFNSVSRQTALPSLSPSLTAVSSTTLMAAWNALPGINYVIALASDAGFANIISSATQSASTAAFSGLNADSPYYLEVKPAANTDVSFGLNTVSQRTLPAPTVMSPVVTAVSSTTLNAAWTATPGASYVAVLAQDSGFALIVSSRTQAANTASFASLSPDTSYYFEIKLSTEADVMFTANTAWQKTNASATALQPVLTAATTSGLTAYWNAMPGSAYVVALSTSNNYGAVLSSTTETSPSKTFAGLLPYTTYYVQVKLAGESDTAFQENRVSGMTAATLLRVMAVAPITAAAGNSSVNLTISGEGFTGDASVKLTRLGQSDVNPISVTVESPTKITSVFRQPFASGRWNIVVNSGGQSLEIKDGFALLGAEAGTAKIYQGVFKPKQGESANLATSITSAGQVTIKVYDELGRQIREIVNGNRAAGNYIDLWDGKTGDGDMAASGVYLVRFECPGFSSTKRVVVIK